MSESRRFVIGDIHGCIRTFRYLVKDILNLEPADTLFLLGDVIDRGPESKAVLDYIMELSARSIVRPILGNHEYMMLGALEDEDLFLRWHKNGCEQTLLSFGVDQSRINDRSSLLDIAPEYFAFLRKWPLYEETQGFFLVHAGLDPLSNHPLSDIRSLLWTRDENPPQDIIQGRRLIHGHTPLTLSSINQRVLDPNATVLNLDGGCVYKDYPGLGYLVALDLDQMRLYRIRNRD
jgi:serine/threonine protein phosphatase 1